LKTEADKIFFGYDLISGYMLENEHNIFGLGYERAQFKSVEEVTPGIVYDLIVVFFLSKR